MTKIPIRPWRRWLTWSMVAVLVVSLATWYGTRDTLPSKIRIGTAVEGGMYHDLGEHLSELLHERTGQAVELPPTLGSKENCKLLCNKDKDKHIDVAIVQAGAVGLNDKEVNLDDLALVTPLYHDVVVALVRRELLADDAPGGRVDGILDLAREPKLRVIVGEEDSGMYASAHDILEKHYKILDQIVEEKVHFHEALRDDEAGRYDAAIVTTGLEAQNLAEVLATGRYGILPLDARALERRFGHFQDFVIPSHFWPQQPEEGVPTVATPALVVVRQDASPRLVSSLLDCVNDPTFRRRYPALIRPGEDTGLSFVRLHPEAKRYYDPLHGFSWLANSLESIAAGRELLVAIFAGLVLVWDHRRRKKHHARQDRINAEKARLGDYLERTLRIERRQMNETDPETLGKFLDEVTEIKLRALAELSHEELLDHRAFSIFLMQCANLINKIQMKIMRHAGAQDET